MWQINCASAVTPTHLEPRADETTRKKSICNSCWPRSDSVHCCPYIWIITSGETPTLPFSPSSLYKLFIFGYFLSAAKDPGSRGLLCIMFYTHRLSVFTVYAICILRILSNLTNHFRSNSANTERHIYMVIVCYSVSSRSSQTTCFVFMKSPHPDG